MKNLFIPLALIILFISCSEEGNNVKKDELTLDSSCEFLKDTVIKDFGSVLSQSQDSFYYGVWKSELLVRNGIESSYFDQHFQNIHLSSKEWKNGITFRVDYLFNFDWLKFKVTDQFLIKLNSSFTAYQYLNIPRDILLDAEWTTFNIRNDINYTGTCKINKIDRLLYKSCKEAYQSFKDSSGYDVIYPERISLYVPGKLPRIDGYPYFIGSGIIDSTTYDCVKGYFNLVNGTFEVWEDYCGPIN